MRLIDADALSKSVLEWLPSDPCGRPEVEHPFETDICVSMLMEIEDAPTVDAVEVVRCKDCKYWHSNTEFCDIWSFANIAQRTLEYDYCSRGERRGDSEA